MNTTSWIKFAGGIIGFIISFYAYRDVKGKKMLRMGDDQFFNEDKNRVSPTYLVNSWGLVVMSFLMGIVFIVWAFE